MAFKATPQQELAIKRQGNILVSAAAGSGKTAVLVERVIRLLTDDKLNINADELLIVTFTNAAAAEMRSRIEKRIDEECRKNQNSTALLRQKHLLSNAKICTIDSFCIDLVRENFDKLSIAPDFKISDNATLNQINEEVVYNIINRYIETENPTFSQLVDLTGGEYDEKNLADLLLAVYEYSRQLPYPEKWYNSLISCYQNGQFTSDNIWYGYAFSKAEDAILEVQDMLINFIDLISELPAAANLLLPTLQSFAEDISALYESANTSEWDTFYNHLNKFCVPSLPTVRGEAGKYREIKAFKDAFKLFKEKTFPSLSKLFYADSAFINTQFGKLYPCIELFVEILRELDSQIFDEYNARNTFTFHNIEHLALKLLCREEDGKIVVSENGRELLEQYKEVMVDEYQDTNDLQDYLFLVLSNFEEKLFVVGDVKQSIYAFRGANPVNFLNKKQRYIPVDSADESMAQKIILANNFRTKSDVCDFINYFFEMFMTHKTGMINYDAEERLIPTAVYPETNIPSVTFDIINCKGSDEKAWVLEARQIAAYIKATMSNGDVIRSDDTTLRPARFGDFTILMRSLTNAPYIINELKQQGIPVDLSLDSFAENREISTVLALLRVIDNPDSDIELLTLLLSPIFAFSTDDIAEIRANKKDGTLLSSIIKASENGYINAGDFLKKLEQYRLYAVSLKLPELINKLLIETEFLNIISAFSDGVRRKNNLLLLIETAQQFTENRGVGLTKFVEYVNRVSQAGGKAASSANDNSVKIMTIHGSKGLQFPICILIGIDSRFNDDDAKHASCFNVDFGIGFKYFDEDFKMPLSTIAREVIIDNTKNVSLQDELRLLYVALTRTQDKLLMISSFKNFDNALEKYKNRLVMYGCDISKAFFSRTASFADWLIPSLLLHPDGNKLRESGDMLSIIDTRSHIDINIIEGISLSFAKEITENITYSADFELADAIKKNTEFAYPYADVLKIRSKTSVSALANKSENDKFAFESKPSFMSRGGMSATDRGTAMHRVMQYFDFDKSNDINNEIERLYEWQYISENEYNAINREALNHFFASDIFKRIKNADLVKREMRFLTEVPATMVEPSLDSRFSDEKIIIQGAVDVCFIENGELVILDFKTDKVDEPSALSAAYGMQLSIYALACEKIFNMPIKEKIIYSFNLGKTINI